MISKELLSEVLNVEINSVDEEVVDPIDNTFYYTVTGYDGLVYQINIYELAHKCKEWGENYGFSLISSTSYEGDGHPTCCPVYKNGCYHSWIDGSTEAEAIFKACEWILKQNE